MILNELLTNEHELELVPLAFISPNCRKRYVRGVELGFWVKKLTGLSGPTLLPTLDFLGQGVIDGENTAVELCAVHVVHGGDGVLFLQEGNEAEGPVLLGGLVQRRLDVFNVPERYERRVQYRLVHVLR